MTMSDDLLKEIDIVAREMTTGEPSNDLRARVSARLDAPARSHRGRAWIWIPTAAAAMAAIVLYLTSTPPVDGGRSGVERIAEPPVLSGASQPALPGGAPAPVVATAPVPRARSTPQSGVARANPVETHELEFDGARIDVAALNETEPITTSSLTNDPIALDAMETVPPLAVTPLSN